MIVLNNFTLCRDDFDDLERLQDLLSLVGNEKIRKTFYYRVSAVEVKHSENYNLIAGDSYPIADIIIDYEPFNEGPTSLRVFLHLGSTLIYRRTLDASFVDVIKSLS